MLAIIVKWIALLIAALKLGMGSFLARALAGGGLALVNFRMVMPEVKSWLLSRLDGLGAQAVNMIAACGVDIFMVAILSAMLVKMGFRTITAALSSLQGLTQLEPGT